MKGNTKQKTVKTVSFALGSTYMTPGAKAEIPPHELLTALRRHSRCDWGDCCPDDWKENDFSVDKYLRLFSVYHSSDGTKFWIITEADRSSTTILLPDEY
jgi:hypothetical protein